MSMVLFSCVLVVPYHLNWEVYVAKMMYKAIGFFIQLFFLGLLLELHCEEVLSQTDSILPLFTLYHFTE